MSVVVCSECYHENSSQDVFCARCGTRLQNTYDEQQTEQATSPMLCPRCDRPLSYVGTKDFHEGPGGGVFSDWTELFMNKERFDVYVCRRCGRVEFFVDGIGEQFRPREPNA